MIGSQSRPFHGNRRDDSLHKLIHEVLVSVEACYEESKEQDRA